MIRIYKASKGQLKHREIFDEIKKKIDNGEWKEGKAIPTERELAEHFLSSRTTIRNTCIVSTGKEHLHYRLAVGKIIYYIVLLMTLRLVVAYRHRIFLK